MNSKCLLLVSIAFSCLVATAASTIAEVELSGKYSWKLLYDIDNHGGSEYVRQHTLVSSSEVKKSEMVDALKRIYSSSSSDTQLEPEDSFKMLNASSSDDHGFNYHMDAINETITSEQDIFAFRKIEIVTEKVTVLPEAKLRQYQLQYNAPGISLTFPITTNDPKDVPVTVRFQVEIIRKKSLICDGCKFALLTHHGNYVSAKKDIKDAPVNLASSIGDTEKWTFVHLYDDVYGIRSVHGTYLSVREGGEGSSVGLQYDRHNWAKMQEEQWIAVVAPTGKIAFRSVHGTYLRSNKLENLVDIQIDRHNWAIMRWEQYTLIPVTETEAKVGRSEL